MARTQEDIELENELMQALSPIHIEHIGGNDYKLLGKGPAMIRLAQLIKKREEKLRNEVNA